HLEDLLLFFVRPRRGANRGGTVPLDAPRCPDDFAATSPEPATPRVMQRQEHGVRITSCQNPTRHHSRGPPAARKASTETRSDLHGRLDDGSRGSACAPREPCCSQEDCSRSSSSSITWASARLPPPWRTSPGGSSSSSRSSTSS